MQPVFFYMNRMTMRLWIINFPNSARILKCSTVIIGIMCFYSIIEMLKLTNKGGHYSRTKSSRVTPIDNVTYTHHICVGFLGRLGNQIFQFASAYGIARQKGMRVRISSSDQINGIFKLKQVQIIETKHHCGHAAVRFERYTSAYDSKLLEFSGKKDVLLLQFLQSWKYFIKVSDDLRSELTFKDEIYEKAHGILYNKTKSNKYFRNNSTYVGMHVRRGDMLTVKRVYNIASRQYIINAMSYFLNHYKHVIFIICSDDIRWVKQQIGKYTKMLNLVFIEKNLPEVDLAILSQCNHTIMTTGTFSWWAAWLAGGDAVYYKHYIPETSSLRTQFSQDFSDYFMPHWIPLE